MAYDLSQRTELLYNIGQAADRSRHDEVALDAFRRYLDANPTVANREEIAGRIEFLERALAAHSGPAPEPPAPPTPDTPPTAVAPESASVVPPPEEAAAPPSAPAVVPSVPSIDAATTGAPRGRHWDPLLFIIGASAFGALWIGGGIGWIGQCAAPNGCNDSGQSIGLAFIPVIGPLVSATTNHFFRPDYGPPAIGVGVALAVLEAAGIALAAYGLTTYVDDEAPVALLAWPEPGGASIGALGRF